MNIADKHFGRFGNRLFQCAYIYAQMRDGVIPDIYLQDPKYFDKYRDEIRKLFGEGIVKSNYVSIHIRRGDYVNNPFYVDLMKTDYYEKARELFPNETFLVFSDDIKWCKENVKGFEHGLFSESEEEDFKVMAGCKGHIISNSSFSWWAAYLGDGKTVYPKAWFTDGQQRVGFLNEWVCL